MTRIDDQTKVLLNLAFAEVSELFHTVNAELAIVGQETLRLGSRRFELLLREKYYLATGKAPSKAAVNRVVGTLQAKAMFEGRSVDNRRELQSECCRFYREQHEWLLSREASEDRAHRRALELAVSFCCERFGLGRREAKDLVLFAASQERPRSP
jgi:hypothetical protein